MPITVAFYDAYAYMEGCCVALLDILAHLDRSRFVPILVCPRDGEVLQAAKASGCETAIVRPPWPLLLYGKALTSRSVTIKASAAGAIVRYAWRLRRWLRAKQVDVLHCNQTRAVLQAGLGARLAGVPVVWNVRLRQELSRSATRFVAWCSDAVATLSLDSLDGFRGKELLTAQTVEIPLGIDADRFRPAAPPPKLREELGVAPDERIVLMVGCLHPRKRHDLLLEAAPRIASAVPDARVLVAGGTREGETPQYHQELLRRRAELGMDDQVRFLGRREDVPDLLHLAEVFVLPSRQEGTPGAVLEAMASGRACIVTPAAAASVEDGVTGLVVEPGNPEALADAVVAVLRDPGLAGRLGQAARQRVLERHSLRATVEQYEELYERLVAARPRPRGT